MTLLAVHDIQQELAYDFLKKIPRSLSRSELMERKAGIYLMGQEMGFCNDEIDLLLEEWLGS